MTGGRPQGCPPTRFPRRLKEMILGALDKAGGEKYLADQAKDNPTAFLTLIGKVLPLRSPGPTMDRFRVTVIELCQA